MRACDFKRKVLSAQIGLEDVCSVGSISQSPQYSRPAKEEWFCVWGIVALQWRVSAQA
jgi:hypothetical protein